MYIRLVFFIILYALGFSLYSQQQRYESKLIPVCDYCEQVSTYDSTAWSIRKLYPDSTIYYSEKIIALLTSKGDTNQLAKYYNYQGLAYHYKGNNLKSYDLYLFAYKYAFSHQDTLQYGHAMNNLGRFYSNQGDYSKAIEYCSKALTTFKELNDLDGTAYALKRMSELYIAQGYLNDALQATKSALDIRLKNFNLTIQLNAHIDLANIYTKMDSMEQAFNQYKLAKLKAEQISDEIGIANTEIGLANLYFDLSLFKDASKSAINALNIASKFSNTDLKNRALIVYGKSLFFNGQINEAENQFRKILIQSDLSNQLEVQREANFYLAETSIAKNEGLSAYKFQKAYNDIDLQLSRSEARRAIDSVLFVVELSQREVENNLLRLSDEKNSALIQLQRFQNYVLFFAVIFVAILTLIFWLNLRKRRNLNKLLRVKNADIIDQNNKLVHLNAENAQYKDILENVEEVIYELDADGNYKYVNPVTQKMLGYSQNEFRKKHYLEIVHPTHRVEVKNFYDLQIQKRKEVSFNEFLIIAKNDDPIWFRQTTKMEFDADGKVVRIIAVGQNINEIKVLSQELKEQLDLFRLISENSLDLIAIHETNGNYLYVSPSVKRLLGYEESELIGENPYDFIHSDDQEVLKKGAHRRTLHGQSSKHVEYRMRNKSGEYIWFEAYTTPIFDHKGEISSFQTSSRDITERKKIYRQIQENEANLTALVENTDDVIFSVDNELKLISFNKSFRQGMHLLSSLKLIKGDYLGDKLNQHQALWNKCFDRVRKGDVFSADFDIDVNDSVFEYECSFNPIVAENNIIGFTVFGRNVTDKRNEERKILRYQEGLRLINQLSLKANIEIDVLLKDALSVVSNYLHLPIGIISRIEGQQYYVEHYFSQNDVGLVQNQEFKLGSTYCDITLANKGVTTILDMANSQYHEHPCFKDFQLASYMGAILYVDGEKYGTVNFSSPNVRTEKFDELDRDFIVLFTNWVGATILRDKTNNQLKSAKIKAESAAEAKADFLSVMSHEIRTPLNGIIGITNILLRDQPREDQFKNLNLLKFSGDNLLVIINDILDFNKIEANKITLEQIEFNLYGLLESIQQTNNFKIDGNELKLILDYDKQLQQIYIGDAVRLGQVLNNLTSNAIKFTKKGSVTLKASLVAGHLDYHSIKIEVIDTGKGIKAENFNKIFERYSQEEESTTREYGGTGLGLPISQKLLNLMGSKIELDSKMGVGSNFYFLIDLPIAEINSLLELKVDPFQFDDLTRYGFNVLIVDDNLINYTIAANFLEKWGVKTIHAVSGEVAVDLAKKDNYDLILMDLQMPGMNGYETANAIRKFDAKIPIIALTASQVEEVRALVEMAGMNDLLSKPMTPHQLYSKLATNLNIEHEFSKTEISPLNAIDTQFANIENGLDELSLYDVTFKKELIRLMLLNLNELQTVLTRALQKKEKELAKSIVHKVKMTINTLQLTELNAVAIQIIDYIVSKKHSEQKTVELIQKLDQSIAAVSTILNTLQNTTV